MEPRRCAAENGAVQRRRNEAETRKSMLQIKNLHVSVEGKPILRGIDLDVALGQVHSIMGPNGSGKSTLAQVLAGHPAYEVTDGDILVDGHSVLDMEADERAREGLFLAFQYPVEIPGVSTMEFLKAAYNAGREHRGEPEIDALEFLQLARKRLTVVKMDEALLRRSVNEGFSGGEKKRNEIFQMAVLEPRYAILDETDSGLDIDALRIVADGINLLRGPNRAMVVITHYQRLLNYVQPDFVHVLVAGRIAKSGGKDLALALEERGYAWIEDEVRSAGARS